MGAQSICSLMETEVRDAELRRSAIAMAFPLKRVWTLSTGSERKRR